jgi:hypothetical protein
MTLDLTDPSRIDGSVVAWALLGYLVVFLAALAVAAWFRRRDNRKRRGVGSATVRLVIRTDEFTEALHAARERLSDAPRGKR